MSWSDKEALAAEYALGTLDQDERVRLEAALAADVEFRALVEDWESRLAPLAADVPDEAPPEEVFAAVAAALGEPLAGPAGSVTVRAGTGTWVQRKPGIDVKMLHRDPVGRRQRYLLRLAPGAVLDDHAHDQDEACLMLEGTIRFGELTLSTGDFHLVRTGFPHPPGVSDDGCLVFVSGALKTPWPPAAEHPPAT